MILGIDLDNTIINYESVFRAVAKELGLPLPDSAQGKRSLRDTIRALSDGEKLWRRVQKIVYATRLDDASLYPGVAAFFQTCHTQALPVYIISHKTANIRKNARIWLKQRLLRANLSGVSEKDVYFESSRTEKINRMRILGCTHVIDDLMETFTEPVFPNHIHKLLFDPHGSINATGHISTFRSWDALYAYFFS